MEINNELFKGINLNLTSMDFNNKVTTLEFLHSLLARVNDLYEYFDAVELETKTWCENEIETLKTLLLSEIEKINNSIKLLEETTNNTIDNKYSEIKNLHISDINDVINRITSIGLVENIHYNELQNRINGIEVLINTNNVIVRNPITGLNDSLQSTLDYIYFICVGSSGGNIGEILTPIKYDGFNITAEQYDVLNVTARAYDTDWKTYFAYYITD